MSVSLAEMLTSAVGQSAHLHTVSAENLRQIYPICASHPSRPSIHPCFNESPDSPLLTR